MVARFDRWKEHATDAELEAFIRWPGWPDPELADPELHAELTSFTNEQLDAVIRGVPLATVRKMQHPARDGELLMAGPGEAPLEIIEFKLYDRLAALEHISRLTVDEELAARVAALEDSNKAMDDAARSTRTRP
jgi:hypothetical protein